MKRNNGKEIKKKLLFGETLSCQIRDNMKNKSRKEKRLLVSAISGKIIQDYKCSVNLAFLTSRKLNLLRSQSFHTKKRDEEKLIKTRKDIQKYGYGSHDHKN